MIVREATCRYGAVGIACRGEPARVSICHCLAGVFADSDPPPGIEVYEERGWAWLPDLGIPRGS